MKALFLLSIFTGMAAAALLLWWDAVDGTRFQRAMEDLSRLSSGDLERHRVIDPWGNPYLEGETRPGERSVSYFFSQGPDGRSGTLGHDSDDIIAGKGRFEWLVDLHRARWIWSVLLISGGSALAAGMMLVVRRQAGKGPV